MVEYSSEQFDKDLKKDLSRQAVAGVVMMGSAITSLLFLPAIGGALVGCEEFIRNGIKLPLRLYKYGSISPKNADSK